MRMAAATGTTNRALACYLVRRNLAGTGTDNSVVIAAQGVEMGKGEARLVTRVRACSKGKGRVARGHVCVHVGCTIVHERQGGRKHGSGAVLPD